jgi:hypothetical protein
MVTTKGQCSGWYHHEYWHLKTFHSFFHARVPPLDIVLNALSKFLAPLSALLSFHRRSPTVLWSRSDVIDPFIEVFFIAVNIKSFFHKTRQVCLLTARIALGFMDFDHALFSADLFETPLSRAVLIVWQYTLAHCLVVSLLGVGRASVRASTPQSCSINASFHMAASLPVQQTLSPAPVRAQGPVLAAKPS